MTNLNINFKKMLKETKFNAARIIIVGFLWVIIVGTLMLMLPVSSAKGQWTDFVTALFTATTSTCVTGLVVVPTYAYWSLFGKVVILILIQLGGLGIISIATGVLIIIGKKINLKERRLIQESYNLDTSQGVVLHIIRIFSGILFVYALANIVLLMLDLDYYVTCASIAILGAAFLYKRLEFLENKFCFIDAYLIMIYKAVLEKIR